MYRARSTSTVHRNTGIVGSWSGTGLHVSEKTLL